MALTPKIEIKQSQSLLMTPQLRQAINLLQMSNLELGELVSKELETNPFLEREDERLNDSQPHEQTIDDYDAPQEAPNPQDETPDIDYDNSFDDDFGSDREGYEVGQDADWRDYLPPFFQKTNKIGVQKNILYLQGAAVTLLSLLFVVMPSVQSFYQIMSQLTVVLYLIMYMLMFSAAIYLRYNMKKSNRPFRIGGKGNGMMWFIGGLGFLGSLLAFVLSFIPPSQISVGSNAVWFSVLIIGTLVVVIAPFIIYASRKPSWTNKESQFEPFHWEEGATTPAAPTATSTPAGNPAAQATAPKAAASAGNTTTTTQTSTPKPTPGSQPGTPTGTKG